VVLRSLQLMESVDEFVAMLCHCLTISSGRDDGQQVKDILKESLPNMSRKLTHTYTFIHM